MSKQVTIRRRFRRFSSRRMKEIYSAIPPEQHHPIVFSRNINDHRASEELNHRR